MLTAEAGARESAWALAMRARCCTLVYSGMAMAARMPMMAITIIKLDEREAALVARHCPSTTQGVCQRCDNSSQPSISVTGDTWLTASALAPNLPTDWAKDVWDCLAGSA